MRDFVQREGLSESAMELHGELELLHLLSHFFDLMLYAAAVGYEQEHTAWEGRKEGAKEISIENPRSVSTGEDSCLPQYPLGYQLRIGPQPFPRLSRFVLQPVQYLYPLAHSADTNSTNLA